MECCTQQKTHHLGIYVYSLDSRYVCFVKFTLVLFDLDLYCFSYICIVYLTVFCFIYPCFVLFTFVFVLLPLYCFVLFTFALVYLPLYYFIYLCIVLVITKEPLIPCSSIYTTAFYWSQGQLYIYYRFLLVPRVALYILPLFVGPKGSSIYTTVQNSIAVQCKQGNISSKL